MRILIYTKNITKKIRDITKEIEKDFVTRIDLIEDYEEAEYCVRIRFYDLILVEFEKERRIQFMNFFNHSRKKNKHSNIIIFGKDITDSELDLYKKYNLSKIIYENLNEGNIKNIIQNTYSTIIENDILKIDVKNKKVWIMKEGYTEISFKKKIDFYVFLYFMRHYKETINISNLLDATCEEPELTKDSIIESSISSLRKTFNNLIGVNPIKAFKKIGYNFALQKQPLP